MSTYSGYFINQTGKRVEIEIGQGSENKKLTIQALTINSASDNQTIYTPLKYSTMSMTVLTDDVDLYLGALLEQDVVVKVDYQPIFSGKFLQMDNSQAFNYSLESLTFVAVDNLTMLKSVRETRTQQVTISDYLYENLGDFLYIPELQTTENDALSLLNCKIYLKNWVQSDDTIVYKSLIVSDLLDYLCVAVLGKVDGYYVLANPRILTTQESTGYINGENEEKTIDISRIQLNGQNARAQVSLQYRPQINSITLRDEFTPLSDVIDEKNEEINEKETEWLSNKYDKMYVNGAPCMRLKSWSNKNNYEFERYDDADYSYLFPSPSVAYEFFSMACGPVGDRLLADGFNIDEQTQSTIPDHIQDTIVEYHRLGFVKDAPQKYYLKEYRSWQGDEGRYPHVSTASYNIDELYALRKNQNLNKTDFIKLCAKTPNSALISKDGQDYSVVGGWYASADAQRTCGAWSYNGYGAPSFSENLTFRGLHGLCYIYNLEEDLPYAQSPMQISALQTEWLQRALYGRDYIVDELPALNNAGKTYYIVIGGSVRFSPQLEGLSNADIYLAYSYADTDQVVHCTICTLTLYDADDNIILSPYAVTPLLDINKNQNILDTNLKISNTTRWDMGIADEGFAIQLDAKLAKKIHKIHVDYVIDPRIHMRAYMPFCFRAGKNVLNLPFEAFPISAVTYDVTIKLAQGWIVDEEEPTPDEIEDDETADNNDLVYYWRNNVNPLVQGEEITMANKLCTFVEGKMESVSSPWLGDSAVGELVNVGAYQGQKHISELFRFGQLIDQYSQPRLRVQFPVRGLPNAINCFKYSVLDNERIFTCQSFVYDAVQDVTQCVLEEYVTTRNEIELVE